MQYLILARKYVKSRIMKNQNSQKRRKFSKVNLSQIWNFHEHDDSFNKQNVALEVSLINKTLIKIKLNDNVRNVKLHFIFKIHRKILKQ